MRGSVFVLASAVCVLELSVTQAHAASPYDGYWASNAANCRDREGVEHLSIEASIFQWYETRCRARNVVARGARAWTMNLSCKGEGQSFSTQSRLSLPNPNRLVLDQAPVGPTRHETYVRCRVR